jgi:hypothetical protein
MDLGQKIFIIWQKAEIIPNLLDVAPLVGPPPMKIRVVMFCTLPLVVPSQKCTCFDPSGHLKNGKCIFYVETEKTLVAKVVRNAKMHISTNNGTMVPQFDMELAQTMVTRQGRALQEICSLMTHHIGH